MHRRYSGYYPPERCPTPPPAPPPPPGNKPKPPPKPLPGGVDMGDLVLLALLWYLYRESRDEEFLLILLILAAKIFNLGAYFSSSPFSSLLGSLGV